MRPGTTDRASSAQDRSVFPENRAKAASVMGRTRSSPATTANACDLRRRRPDPCGGRRPPRRWPRATSRGLTRASCHDRRRALAPRLIAPMALCGRSRKWSSGTAPSRRRRRSPARSIAVWRSGPRHIRHAVARGRHRLGAHVVRTARPWEWLKPGTHVDLVGAYLPTMREGRRCAVKPGARLRRYARGRPQGGRESSSRLRRAFFRERHRRPLRPRERRR